MQGYDADLDRLTQLRKLFEAFLDLGAQRTDAQVAQLEAKLLVYLDALSDIAPADLAVVVAQCVAECKFLPRVAEIREVYINLRGGLTVQTAAEAWAIVLKAIRREGHVNKPNFSNPLTERAVGSMGWRELCLSEAPPGVDRAQFERIYNSHLERAMQMERLLPPARAMLEQSEVNRLFAGVAETRRLLGPVAAGGGDNESA